MDAAQSEKPQGPKYRKIIGVWLRCHGFDRIDEGDRSRLLKCYDNFSAINAWRSALPAEEQAKLNHPRVVLARWQRSLKPQAEPAESAEMASEAVTIVNVDVVLTWLQTATAEDKRRVAVALAQDTATMRKILPAKAIPATATPEKIFKRALGLLAPEEGAPAVH
jgi:hypothetical protein